MNISGIRRVDIPITRETVKKVTGDEHIKKAIPEESGENRQQAAALKKAFLSQWPMMAYDGVELNQSRTHNYSAVQL